ncbi:MAG: hypothetical protein KAI29_09555 [Cyclobacteriaceae bacterium]|nr:hypothetical protein [Cyclobacteriaceae bacterium]
MKTLTKTAIFFFVLFLIVYFSANYVLKKLAVKAVAELKPRLEQKGIMIENFNYKNILLNSYNSCAVTEIDLDFHLTKKMYAKESFKARFNANSITVRFADFNNPSFFFTLKDFALFIEPEENSTKKPFGKLENGYLKSRIPLYLKNPEESAREILAEVKTLFRENKTPIDLEITADVLLGIDEKEVKVGLYTERIESWTYLKFDDRDILEAAKEFELDLAEKEAEIIANHPSKVPALIKITRDAKRLSEFELSKNASFPEDAYKHIYWSYHLTREFGADLAKEITDAHETIPNNTENERKMDYHNNKVGRKYANEILSLNEIKKRVLASNEVIRNPNEVK